MLKKIFLIILIIFTTGCGFEPMHSKSKLSDTNFSISKIKLEGDRDINIKIEEKLKRYTQIIKKKTYVLLIESNYIKETIDSWEFPTNIIHNASLRLKTIKEKLGDKPTVSIHIRKGDYTLPQNQTLNIIDDEYYIKALTQNFLPINDYNFLIFSNDIEYAKTQLEGDNVYFVEPKGIDSYSYTSSEKDDLALLSLCDHHIITNSTYSWWGAYLSKSLNKKIICPTNWLKGPSFMNGNHFPSNWINIDNKN